MAQVARPSTAFSLDKRSRQRSQRLKKESHLAFIRRLSSLVPGFEPVEAAHVRYGDPLYAKSKTGMAEKPSDVWVVPLSADRHREQHSGNERAFWQQHGIDPLLIAALLYAHSGNDYAGEQIVRNARMIGKST